MARARRPYAPRPSKAGAWHSASARSVFLRQPPWYARTQRHARGGVRMSDGRVQPMQSGLKQKLDYSDHAGAPEDGMCYEILDGDVLVTPTPSPSHQWVSKRLQRQLETYFEAR